MQVCVCDGNETKEPIWELRHRPQLYPTAGQSYGVALLLLNFLRLSYFWTCSFPVF